MLFYKQGAIILQTEMAELRFLQSAPPQTASDLTKNKSESFVALDIPVRMEPMSRETLTTVNAFFM